MILAPICMGYLHVLWWLVLIPVLNVHAIYTSYAYLKVVFNIVSINFADDDVWPVVGYIQVVCFQVSRGYSTVGMSSSDRIAVVRQFANMMASNER